MPSRSFSPLAEKSWSFRTILLLMLFTCVGMTSGCGGVSAADSLETFRGMVQGTGPSATADVNAVWDMLSSDCQKRLDDKVAGWESTSKEAYDAWRNRQSSRFPGMKLTSLSGGKLLLGAELGKNSALIVEGAQKMSLKDREDKNLYEATLRDRDGQRAMMFLVLNIDGAWKFDITPSQDLVD